MFKLLVVFAVLLPLSSFAGEPQIELPPGAYTEAGADKGATAEAKARMTKVPPGLRSYTSSCAPEAELKSWKGKPELQYQFPSRVAPKGHPCSHEYVNGNWGAYIPFRESVNRRLKPGTYELPYGMLVIHMPKKSK